MKKKKDQRKRGPTKKILSSETSPLWMSLGLPSSGPQKIDLHCRSQSLDQMPTLYVVSDAMNLLLVLARRAKQKRDGEALLNLVLAAKTINGLLKSLERTHRELFNFAAELSEWPMNLAPKQQMVDAAVARLVRLRVGTHSAPPTWRGVQIESGNCRTYPTAGSISFTTACRKQCFTSSAACGSQQKSHRRTCRNAGHVFGPVETRTSRFKDLGSLVAICTPRSQIIVETAPSSLRRVREPQLRGRGNEE